MLPPAVRLVRDADCESGKMAKTEHRLRCKQQASIKLPRYSRCKKIRIDTADILKKFGYSSYLGDLLLQIE